MPKVLIIAYYFPPLGMGGIQRIAKLVKYLPQFGWQPTVITVKDIAYYAKDVSLLRDVDSARVIRAGSLEPQRMAGILAARTKPGAPASGFSPGHRLGRCIQSLLAWFFIPDAKLLWLPFALARSFLLLRNERFAAVLTTSPPHSAHFIGWLLNKLYRLPWVADFRDGWSLGEFQPEPTRYHRWLNRHLEAFVVAQADAVVTVSDGLTRRYSRLRTGQSQPHTITNGFDPDDLRQAIPAPRQKRFRICHCGAVGAINDPASFLLALRALLDEQPALQSEIEVLFIGTILKPSTPNLVESLELAHNVKLLGNLPHPVALGYTLSADLLLLIISGSASSAFLPGKVFEYLAAQKNILALIPEGETARLLQNSKNVYFAKPGNLAEVKNVLHTCMQNMALNKMYQDETDFLVQFDRKQLAQNYAQLLRSLPGIKNTGRGLAITD